MKKVLPLLLFVLIGLTSLAQTPDTASKASGTATIYFMRAQMLMVMYISSFSAFIDGELVCRLDDQRYSTHEVKPGKHVFNMQAGGKKNRTKHQAIEMTVEAGKTYYLEPRFKSGLVFDVFTQEITENAAKQLMDKYKMKPQKTCLP